MHVKQAVKNVLDGMYHNDNNGQKAGEFVRRIEFEGFKIVPISDKKAEPTFVTNPGKED